MDLDVWGVCINLRVPGNSPLWGMCGDVRMGVASSGREHRGRWARSVISNTCAVPALESLLRNDSARKSRAFSFRPVAQFQLQ